MFQSIDIVGSLSKEVSLIRKRCNAIIKSIKNSNNIKLKSRLKNEFIYLEERRKDLQKIAYSLYNTYNYKDLSMILLIELCNRPIEIAASL